MTTQFLLGCVLLAVLNGPACLAADSCVLCNSHGEATITDQTFSCKCDTGFTGARCQIEMPPCQNGGRCSKCDCDDPFYGNKCESKKPECKNEGKLVDDGKGGFKCQCVGTFYGNNCENGCKTGAALLRDSSNNPLGCYTVKTTADTWFNWNGETTGCAKDGATLVVVDSAAEHEAIKNYLKTLSIPAACNNWLFIAGQRDIQGDCSSAFYWKPLNGTKTGPITQKWFGPNQPDCWTNGGKQKVESCLSYFANGSGWNDFGCDSNACAICEQALISS